MGHFCNKLKDYYFKKEAISAVCDLELLQEGLGDDAYLEYTCCRMHGWQFCQKCKGAPTKYSFRKADNKPLGLRFSEDRLTYIEHVDDDSLASQAGIQAGGWLIAVNGN